MAQQISLGNYPYAATRVKVMKTALIRKEDYSKLMKMQLSEINQYLQQNGYKKEINELATKYAGVELIELALNLSSANTYRKVMRLSSGGLREVVRVFLRRFDAHNVKSIVRGKFSGAAYDEIIASLIPAGDYGPEFLSSLAKKDSIPAMISALNPSPALKEAVRDFERTGSIAQVETVIDREYYSQMYAVADALPGEGRHLKELMKTEIDSSNIRTLIRLKRSGIDAKEIKKNLNFNGFVLSKKALESLAESKDVNELVQRLEKTYYGKIISKGAEKYKKEGTLSVIETELTKNLLRQGALFMHQNPLSIGPIIGFSIAKEAEVRNLKMIAHARHRGLPESFMDEMLVV